MIIGLGLFTRGALAATVFYIVHHILVKSNLFLIGGIIGRRTGTQALEKTGGLYAKAPWLALLFLIPAMSLGGHPSAFGILRQVRAGPRGPCARPGLDRRRGPRGGPAHAVFDDQDLERGILEKRTCRRPPTGSQGAADDVDLFCYLMLAISLGMAAFRLFLGATAADRVLAIDLLAVITAAAVLLHAIVRDSPVFLDVVVVLGVIVFFGTVALARILEKSP